MNNQITEFISIIGGSGSGKTTLANKIKDYFNNLGEKSTFVVSDASRTPRKGEIHGTDYYFVNSKTIQNEIGYVNKVYIDKEKRWGYGVKEEEINRILKQKHKIAIYPVIDIKMAAELSRYLKNNFNIKAKIIFMNPSLEIAKKLLNVRGTESDENIKIRMERNPKKEDFIKEEIKPNLIITDPYKSFEIFQKFYEDLNSLKNYHPQFKKEILKFADPLKNKLVEIFDKIVKKEDGTPFNRKDLEFYKENVTINNKIIRQVMLNFGIDILRYGTDKNKNNLINKYYNKDINKKTFKDEIFKVFMLNIDYKENDFLSFKEKEKKEPFLKIKVQDYKEKFLEVFMDFVDNQKNKEILMSDNDTLAKIVSNNIPNDRSIDITDCRFPAEFDILLEDYKERSTFYLVILLKNNTLSNTATQEYIPHIKNEGKEIDPDALYSVYDKSKNLEELYNTLNKDFNIAPAEYINIAYTLNYFKKINNLPRTNLDNIIEKTDIFKNTTVLAYPFGLNEEKLLNDYHFNEILKDKISKNNKINNEINVFFGCSENGKDHIQGLISNLKIPLNNNSEVIIDNQNNLHYINPTISMIGNKGQKFLNNINEKINNLNLNKKGYLNKILNEYINKSIKEFNNTKNIDF